MGRKLFLTRAGESRPTAGLHVVAAIQSFRPHLGGAELQLERLAPHLARHGVCTEILTRAAPGWPRRQRIDGSLVRRSPIAGESPLASVVYVATALVHLARRRRRVDLVHAHGALSPATIALGARLLRLPSLVTVLGTGPHGDLARLAGKPFGRVRGRLLARAAWFVALSADARRELLDFGVPARRIFTVPNGVDLASYRPADAREQGRLRQRLGLPPGRFVAAFVGRLHPVKDLDTLLESWKRMSELDLLVVGDGPDRARLESITDRLGIRRRVTFLGESAAVADILRASDCFLLSSRGEGMSNALLEAMACGLPCLASQSVGGARELLDEGRGLLVADGDVAAWTDAIGAVAGDPGLRAKMGGAAARFVGESLSMEAAAERMAQAYAVVAGVSLRAA